MSPATLAAEMVRAYLAQLRDDQRAQLEVGDGPLMVARWVTDAQRRATVALVLAHHRGVACA